MGEGMGRAWGGSMGSGGMRGGGGMSVSDDVGGTGVGMQGYDHDGGTTPTGEHPDFNISLL